MADFDTSDITRAITEERNRIAGRNPWLQAGRAISQAPVDYGSMKPWERAIARTLQGFGAGASASYGGRQVREQEADLMNRAYNALGSDTPLEALASDPQLRDVAGAYMASKYDYDLGRAAEKDSAAIKSLYEHGAVLDDKTQSFYSVPGFQENRGGNRFAEKFGERSGTLRADSKYGYAAEEAKARGSQEGSLQGQINLGRKAAYESGFGSESGKLAGQYAPIQGADGEPLAGQAQAIRNPKIVKIEQDLRKEFQGLPTYKNFTQMTKVFDSMVGSYYDKGPAADLDFVFGVMKMLDPVSVVRGSEQEAAQKLGGIYPQIFAAWQTVEGGGKLHPDVKKSLMSLASRRHDSEKKIFDLKRQEYARIAEEQGGQGRNVTLMPESSSARESIGRLEGRTAVNPETGERRVFDSKTQSWVPIYGR